MGICSTILSKAIGAGALYLGLKDAHICGLAGKNKNPKAKIAQNYPDLYINSQRMETLDTMPVITSMAKKGWFGLLSGAKIGNTIFSITGYFSGLTFGLINNILPLTLGGVALLTKGLKSKGCAIALAVGAGLKFLTNVLSIGQYKKL